MHMRRVVPATAMFIYVASLLLPVGNVLKTPPWEPSPALRGYGAFLIALVALRNPNWETAIMFASWLANPLFGLGCYWCFKGRIARATIVAGAGIILGLSILPLAWDMVARWPGYWVWLASFLTLLAGCALPEVRVAANHFRFAR